VQHAAAEDDLQRSQVTGDDAGHGPQLRDGQVADVAAREDAQRHRVVAELRFMTVEVLEPDAPGELSQHTQRAIRLPVLRDLTQQRERGAIEMHPFMRAERTDIAGKSSADTPAGASSRQERLRLSERPFGIPGTGWVSGLRSGLGLGQWVFGHALAVVIKVCKSRALVNHRLVVRAVPPVERSRA
jgi:hypothetical protein